MISKSIVVDANILIRAVLGRRVRQLIIEYARSVNFYTPEIACDDARKYLPGLLKKRGVTTFQTIDILDNIIALVKVIDQDIYQEFKQLALARIAIRDAEDWPILACAMRFDCPIWTEDVDFFGSGVATWTTDRIDQYLRG